VAHDFLDSPDIAIEIASLGQSANELSERCRWYVENGVQISVLVNPRTRSLTDSRPGLPSRVLRGGDEIDYRAGLPRAGGQALRLRPN
jgi:Uma2 family endonuclease